MERYRVAFRHHKKYEDTMDRKTTNSPRTIIKTRSPKKKRQSKAKGKGKKKKEQKNSISISLITSVVFSFFSHINVQSVSIFLENMRILA